LLGNQITSNPSLREPTTGRPRVDGIVFVNASSREPWSIADNHRVDRLIEEISYAPAGMHVTITVKARQHVPVMAVEYLRDNGRHLGSLTIACSDPDTIARWVAAFRGDRRRGE